ncbi:MAG: SMC family ATPase [Anaerolineae bacterium]|nr:MAG: SMC family ATPase [Anaerolineae bacterium]
MIPIELRIRGFLSYRDEAILNFESFHTACISGHNGAGKSSLLDAMTWALFGRARRNDENIIHLKEDVAQVSFTFAYEGNVYRVVRTNPRGKTTTLEFQIRQADGSWKPLSERSLRETDARIRQLLGLDYETFVNAAFFLQGEADSFTRMKPAERKKVLSNILGLEQWEVYRQRTRERIREIESQIENIRRQIEEKEIELAEEPQRKQAVERIQHELADVQKICEAKEAALASMKQTQAMLDGYRKTVVSIEASLHTTRQELQGLQARLKQRTEEQEAYRNTLEKAEEIKAAYDAWQQARAELEHWETIAVQFREQQKLRQQPLANIQAERARLEQELHTLETRASSVDVLRQDLETLEADLQAAHRNLQEVEEKLAQRASLQDELRSITEERTRLETENRQLKQEMQAMKERLDMLEGDTGSTCPTCGQELTEEHRQELTSALRSDGKSLAGRYHNNKENMDTLKQRAQAIQEALRSLDLLEGQQRKFAAQVSRLQTRQEQLLADLEAWQKEGLPRLETVRRCLAEEAYAEDDRAVLAEIDARCQALGYDPAAHEAAREREQSGRTAEESLRVLERAQAALLPLEREIQDLKAQIKEREERQSTLEEDLQQARKQLAEAQEQNLDVEQAWQELRQFRERERALNRDLGAAKQRLLVLDTLRVERRKLRVQQDELALTLSRYKQLEQAFGKKGAPALLIEAALPEIETHANDVLERLSNGEMNVHFITQQAYKGRRDDMKETLDIQIRDGNGTRPYEMFSGGEAFRVDFAIRLALSRVLAARAGARLQTLVIDEGFGSQDAEGRQRLVEAINLIKDDFAKILVITHIESLKDAFPTRIQVIKTPEGSRISVE